ncbi:MAG: PEP-CTERM sorting domain-containing protein [Planctomycetota bacterium]
MTPSPLAATLFARLAPITALAASTGLANAATIPLASTMNGDGFISEYPGTATFAQINLGDGTLGEVGVRSTDADGLYGTQGPFDPMPGELPTGTPFLFGTPVDVFPREENFKVGSFTVDESSITGSGVETVAIQSIDLGELWTADPNRTSNDPNVEQTIITDISDFGLGLWLFGTTGELTFSALDANDTATFTDGLLTSVDVALDFTFVARDETFFEPDGFTIAGDIFTLSMDDEVEIGLPFGPLNIVVDLEGTVESVGEFSVTEPTAEPLNFTEDTDIPGTQGDPTPGVTLDLELGTNLYTGSAEDVTGADVDTVTLVLPEGAEIESFLLSAYDQVDPNTATGFEVFDSLGNSLGSGSFPADATGNPALPFIPAGYNQPTITFQTLEGVPGNQWTFAITVVPEPASLALLGVGTLAIAGRRRA